MYGIQMSMRLSLMGKSLKTYLATTQLNSSKEVAMHSRSNWKWKWQASSYTWVESGCATAKTTNKLHLSHVGESKTLTLA